MAKRWSINEDYIVCKYCVENRWAYSSDVEIEWIKALLENAGFPSRSNMSIKRRARNYDYLIGGRDTFHATPQEREVLDIVFNGSQRSGFIDRYVKEVYRPNEVTGEMEAHLEDNMKNSSCYLPISKPEVKSTFYSVLNELLEKYYKKYEQEGKTRGAVKKQFKDSLTLTYGVSIDTYNSIHRAKYKTVSKRILFKLFFALELDYEDAKRLLESLGLDFQRSELEEVIIEAMLQCDSSRRFVIYEINDTLERHGCKPLF